MKHHLNKLNYTQVENTTTAIANTCASSHYLQLTDTYCASNQTQPIITGGLPSRLTMQSTNKSCHLNLPQLPAQAQQAHTILRLTHSSLLSIGNCCGASCMAQFTSQHVKIHRDRKMLSTSDCKEQTGLWQIPLQASAEQHTPHVCNSAYNTSIIP